jgi:hypothetical protein
MLRRTIPLSLETPRICKDCAYFRPSDRFWRIDKNATVFGYCEKFGKTDLVTGDVELTYASLCREDETKCGAVGIHYQSKTSANEHGKSS